MLFTILLIELYTRGKHCNRPKEATESPASQPSTQAKSKSDQFIIERVNRASEFDILKFKHTQEREGNCFRAGSAP